MNKAKQPLKVRISADARTFLRQKSVQKSFGIIKSCISNVPQNTVRYINPNIFKVTFDIHFIYPNAFCTQNSI